MNKKVLKTLEYNKIIDLLVEYATSDAGKDRLKNLEPMEDFQTIIQAQKETSDALTRIYQKGSISFGGTKDVRLSLKRLEIGSTLNMEELLKVCSLLETTNRVKQYSRNEDSEKKPDSLEERFLILEPLTPLSSEIRRCIPNDDEISDDASPTLKQIRRSIKLTNEKVHSTLNSIVNGSARMYLQDALITQRSGRYCIPVKAEYRGQVAGMIHDQSSSGSTLFVEPMSVVNLNNDLKALHLKEQEEINVILARLSEDVAAYIEPISTNYVTLVDLDFIFAKAKYAKDTKATKPYFNTRGYINIKEGRHPLLNAKKVVPIDIHMGKSFHHLIVTGPNTGGKTVSIKTVGLLTLMGQAGLHIPAAQRSELALFDEVYADIGDEQSIEQSLSTFSSHMTNIIKIVNEATTNSLVLFDELCAGTDPTEGAALATAILSHLHKQGIRAMATTHYSELKVYALSTEGVENACCEFDVETLSPTYRLLIGVPGKSNAFAISSKLGLPDFLIEDAKHHINDENANFEDLLTELEQSRLTIEKEQAEMKRHKNEIKNLRKSLEKKQERVEDQKERILQDANEQARITLQEAKDFADETIRNFHKFGNANISVADLEKDRAKLREKLKKTTTSTTPKKEVKPKKAIKAATLRLGDSVKVLSLNLEGSVSSLPDSRGNLFVQMGILRSQVNIKDLELIEEESIFKKQENKSNTSKIKMSKSANISPEIKLLGMLVDEALPELDKYLDDAYLAHLPSVRIVHGKGTGALRKAVHSHLKRVKYVKSYRLGEFGEGDAGVTIAEFK